MQQLDKSEIDISINAMWRFFFSVADCIINVGLDKFL